MFLSVDDGVIYVYRVVGTVNAAEIRDLGVVLAGKVGNVTLLGSELVPADGAQKVMVCSHGPTVAWVVIVDFQRRVLTGLGVGRVIGNGTKPSQTEAARKVDAAVERLVQDVLLFRGHVLLARVALLDRLQLGLVAAGSATIDFPEGLRMLEFHVDSQAFHAGKHFLTMKTSGFLH